MLNWNNVNGLIFHCDWTWKEVERVTLENKEHYKGSIVMNY